jgi:quinol-cytochrome oxidoreductase complex cytochrome b subunit
LRLYGKQGLGAAMTRDPARFWWVKLVLVAICVAGVWGFEHMLFPQSSGWIGGSVGLVLGAFMATIYEDYMEQNSG